MEALDETIQIQKYPAYKDSGIDWLGEIPAHWKVKPGFTVIKERKEKNMGMKESTILSLSYGSIIIKPEERLTGLVPESFETYQLVYPGDIIVRPTDLQNDKVSLRTGFAQNKGIITSAYLNFKVEQSEVVKYIYYFLHCLDITKVIYKLGSGLRQNLDFTDFKRFPFILPPPNEQTRIAEFLDRKTAQIDQAIAQKERLIELLNERRQVLIHRAVTRGLNPDAPMKDSGIEWIGEIPTHWEIVPLTKYASRVDYRGKTPEKVEEGIFLVTTKNIKDGEIDYEISKEYVQEKQYRDIMSRGIPRVGDILFTMEAPLGMSAVVDDPTVAIAQRIIKFSFIPHTFDVHFVNYSIQSGYFQKHLQQEGTGSTAIGIKASKLHKLKLLKPPINEQTQIANFITNQRLKSQRVVNQQFLQIQKLQELKATLINSAVTGKIRV